MDGWTGGENGLRGIAATTANVGLFTVNLIDPTQKFYFVLAFVVVALALVERLLSSPPGITLEAIRENEKRRRLRLRCADHEMGCLRHIGRDLRPRRRALRDSARAIVPIDIVTYHNSGLAVMMALLGGINTFFGPFVGAAVFLMLEDVVSNYTSHWQLVVGVLFIVLILFFPRGIWGRWSSLRGGAHERDADHRGPRRLDAVRRFQRAVERVARVEEGRADEHHRPQRRRQEHVVQRAPGSLKPTAGTVFALGRDVTRLPQHRITRLGVAKSLSRSPASSRS